VVRSPLQKTLLAILNDDRHRGRWWTSRVLANEANHVGHATRQQVTAVLASLGRLENDGEVRRSMGLSGHEWASARHPMTEEPTIAKDVRAAWSKLASKDEED
jgi:hypothetical protein